MTGARPGSPIPRTVHALAALGILLGGCSGGPSAPKLVLTTVSVTLSPPMIQLGQTATASAAGLDQNGASIAIGAVTWASGTPGVASITTGGAITAASVGQTQITAVTGGKTGQATLTVVPAPATQIAIAAGNNQNGIVGTPVATPPSAVVKDSYNNPVSGVAVTFAVASGGGSVTGGTQTTNASGVATVGNWTLGATAGANTLTATSTGLTGSPLTFSATAAAGPATQIAIAGGNNQTGLVGAPVGTPPSAVVKDAYNNPVSGIAVTFAVASGGGNVTGGTQTTNASGVATVGSWTLGTTPGVNTLTATSAGLTGSPLTFSVNAAAGAATQIAIAAGNNQNGIVGTPVATPPSAVVKDSYNNPVSGVAVTFAVASGGGGVTGAAQTTNAAGVATVGSWTLGPSTGANTLTATSSGLSGSPLVFTATAGANTATQYVVTSNIVSPVSGTAVTISAQLANAVGGAVQTAGRVVTWQKTGVGGTFGAAQSTTGANGIATVTFSTGVTNAVYQITATDNTSLTGSLTLTTVSGAPARYAVTTNPVSPVAGGSVTVTAQLIDVNGNSVSLSGRTVTWSETGDAGGVFSPATSQTSASGAAATSYTTGASVGVAYTVTALDGSGSTGSASVTNTAGTLASVTWTSGHIVVTDTNYATAGLFTATNQFGRTIASPALTYTSRTASAASVSAAGVVSPLSRGQTMVVANATTNAAAKDSALFAIATPLSPVVRTDLSRFDFLHDTTFTLIVIADMRSATLLGAATVELTWDPTVLKYVSDAEAGSGVGATVGSTNAANGSLTITAASSSGFAGTVQLRRVTFQMQSTAGRAGTLSLLTTELVAASTFTNLLPATLSIAYPLVIR